MTLDEARSALVVAAQQDLGVGERVRELCKAASAYHEARMAAASGATAAKHAQATGRTGEPDAYMPFGRSKGVPVRVAPTDDLSWMYARVCESIDDPAKANFLEKNEALAAALLAELENRGAAP
jgi:hypothetical protein